MKIMYMMLMMLMMLMLMAVVVLADPIGGIKSNVTFNVSDSLNGTLCIENIICSAWSGFGDCISFSRNHVRNCSVSNLGGVCNMSSNFIDSGSESCGTYTGSTGGGGGGDNYYRSLSKGDSGYIPSSDWSCTIWGACIGGRQQRVCTTNLKAYAKDDVPIMEQDCDIKVKELVPNNDSEMIEEVVEDNSTIVGTPVVKGGIVWKRLLLFTVIAFILGVSCYYYFVKDKSEKKSCEDGINDLEQEKRDMGKNEDMYKEDQQMRGRD